jgi:hypothetical protein
MYSQQTFKILNWKEKSVLLPDFFLIVTIFSIMSSPQRYTKVEQGDYEASNTSPTTHFKCERFHVHYKSLLLGLATALLLCIPLIVAFHASAGSTATLATLDVPASVKQLHCGQSVQEALALGCEFDMVSVAWTPKPCIDDISAAEFEKWLGSEERTHPWPFWTDKKAQTQLRGKDAISHYLEGGVWTTGEYHIGHCAFEFRRLQRSVSGDAMVKDYMRNEGHTRHCLDQMLTEHDFNNVDTYFNVSFGVC